MRFQQERNEYRAVLESMQIQTWATLHASSLCTIQWDNCSKLFHRIELAQSHTCETFIFFFSESSSVREMVVGQSLENSTSVVVEFRKCFFSGKSNFSSAKLFSAANCRLAGTTFVNLRNSQAEGTTKRWGGVNKNESDQHTNQRFVLYVYLHFEWFAVGYQRINFWAWQMSGKRSMRSVPWGPCISSKSK